MITLLLYTRIVNKSVLNKLSNLKLQLAALRMYIIKLQLKSRKCDIFLYDIFFLFINNKKKSSLDRSRKIEKHIW